MCLYDGTQWCSVCGEEEGSKNWSLRNPSDQLMFCGYLTSPGNLERPTIEMDSNQQSGIPVNASDERVDRRIWWLTVSKAADRSNRMRTDDLESAFAIRRASVTESSTVSVEYPRLNPDWLVSSRLCFDRKWRITGWKQLVQVFSLWMEGERQVWSYP